MSKHTKEPWEVIGRQVARKPFCRVSIAKVVFDHVEECREYVADFTGVSTDAGIEKTEANAARAVACVNALLGLNPEAVGEAVEALEKIVEYWNGDANDKAMLDACEHNVETARAALAKLRAHTAAKPQGE